ncbi:MAG: DUF1697 domain-containing protein [Planctomycetota bacterium]|nr:DUF1697 domain-containing protein [Planctomycetota bacterium]
MVTYIAWLRGINVGGKNLLPMKELKLTLSEMGLKDVRTHIQSGNVVFESTRRSTATLAKQVSAAIEAGHGMKIPVQVMTRAELQEAFDASPYAEGEGKAVHFYFLAEEPVHADLPAIRELASSTESFELHGLVFHLHAPDGIGRSKLAAKAERLLAVSATGRNLNTVRKVLDM